MSFVNQITMTPLVLIFLVFSECAMEQWDPQTHPRWTLFDHQSCGNSHTDRIIGGSIAQSGQFPWMARLGYTAGVRHSVSYRCGGSLINNLYVLTAAHCVDSEKLFPFKLRKVRLGQHNPDPGCIKNECAPDPQQFIPTKIIQHAEYDSDSLQSDIALIRLHKPATVHSFVTPICMPYGALMNKSNYPKKMEVAGWGLRKFNARDMSKYIYYVRLPLKNVFVCQNKFGLDLVRGHGQICAGGEKGSDSCGGDSGGALMVPYSLNGPPRMYQLGIVSFGMVKCGIDAPAVYTEVTYFLKWILDHIAP